MDLLLGRCISMRQYFISCKILDRVKLYVHILLEKLISIGHFRPFHLAAMATVFGRYILAMVPPVNAERDMVSFHAAVASLAIIAMSKFLFECL